MPADQDRYDAVAYPGLSFPNTHPDRIAVMAILHGLAPAPVDRCRVLEVACGNGGNLIPMAYAIPTSDFVGFDLARLPIERAQLRIRELGLTNIRIFQDDLLEVGSDLGRFDYIIAHGLYSWAPEAVRDRLLALCSELLTADGVAFVSYNALPGSYARRMVREIMLFGMQAASNSEQNVPAGYGFLRQIAAARPENDVYRLILEKELERLEKHSNPAVTFHDELNPAFYVPYFTDFVEHARRHGLEYLADAELPLPSEPCHNAELQPLIDSIAGDDIVRREQMLDFISIRAYRETLLCRAGRPIRRSYFPESFSKLFLSSRNSASPGEKPGSRAFETPAGVRLDTTHAPLVWLLEQLGQAWPHALSFRELMPHLEERGFSLDGSGALLLIRLAVSRMILLRSWNVSMAGSISDRPRASACARQEARMGTAATTLLHLTAELDDPKIRSLFLLLDGTRSHAELVQAMRAEFPDVPASEIEAGLEPCLRQFHLGGALEA
jgi:SAM-dependent methyltransferase